MHKVSLFAAAAALAVGQQTRLAAPGWNGPDVVAVVEQELRAVLREAGSAVRTRQIRRVPVVGLEVDVQIGADAWIAPGVVLRGKTTIGAGATIGAGSTITRNAPDEQLTLERSRQTSLSAWKRPQKKK